jgi:hypothetical protein
METTTQSQRRPRESEGDVKSLRRNGKGSRSRSQQPFLLQPESIEPPFAFLISNNTRPLYTTTQSSTSPPTITQSCIILPLAIAYWWFRTKRAAVNIARGLLPAAATACQDDVSFDDEANEYTTWEEVIQQEQRDPSLRFVRWIKGRSSRQQKTQRVRVMSRRTLHRGSTATDEALMPSESSSSDVWNLIQSESIEMCTVASPASGRRTSSSQQMHPNKNEIIVDR